MIVTTVAESPVVSLKGVTMANASRTPSARYMAAKVLLAALKVAHGQSTEELAKMFESRVSDAKKTKVDDQIGKMTKKFKERFQRIVDAWENPPPKKPGVKPPVGKKKA